MRNLDKPKVKVLSPIYFSGGELPESACSPRYCIPCMPCSKTRIPKMQSMDTEGTNETSVITSQGELKSTVVTLYSNTHIVPFVPPLTMAESTPLRNGVNGLINESNSVRSNSESDTIFSDDYTQMTEGSESVLLSPVDSLSDYLCGTKEGCPKDGEHESEDSDVEVDSVTAAFHELLTSSPELTSDRELSPPSSPIELPDVQINSIESPKPGTPFFEDEEFEFLKAGPVKRSTSLKTYKTPPGTPSRKKEVRFADALGLDLESVKHVMNLEEPPKVPDSAMADLHIGLADEQVSASQGSRYLAVCFKQPCSEQGFYRRVEAEKVVLENCLVNDADLVVTGTIRVANICYHKAVLVRYTVNNWLTSTDVEANYVPNSNDGTTDRFSFCVPVPKYFGVRSRLIFCVRFNGENGMEFWDNNRGKNYIVECFEQNMLLPGTQSDSAWVHFL